jgi:Protein of unknown function (DUF3301)
MPEIATLLVVAAAVWFLWDSLKSREAANRALRAACQAHGLLFLDDTVALAALRPVRNAAGRASLRRIYRFEYSDTGNNRRKGSITMTSDRVSELDLALPEPVEPVTLH